MKISSSWLITNNTSGINTEIKVNGQRLETVTSFKYLDSVKTDEGSKPEILSRIAKTTAALTRLKPVWIDKECFLQLQDTTDALACHIHLPVCLWIMDPHRRAPKKNTNMEMRCYRKILHISYKDHVTNEEIRAKIQQAIGPHEALLTIVKRRKLQWYGHVSRSSGLAETILQQCKAQWKGEEDRADKGRGGKTILGNGQAWSSASPRGQWRTGKKWRKLVAKSSVVPQRPSRLRDWWWWRRTVHEVSYSSTYTRSVSGVCSIVWL